MGKYKLNPTTSELDMVGGDAQGAPAAHKATHAAGGTDALSPADIGAAATGHGHAISDVSGLQTALDEKVGTGDSMRVVSHGTTADTARPAGAAAVYWIGTVEPTNAANNDLWIGGL